MQSGPSLVIVMNDENEFWDLVGAETAERVRRCTCQPHPFMPCIAVHTNRDGVSCRTCQKTARRCDCGEGTRGLCTSDVCPSLRGSKSFAFKGGAGGSGTGGPAIEIVEDR